MAFPRIPAGVDLAIKFTKVSYNVEPSSIDLENVDDFICVVSKDDRSTPALVTLRQSESPLRFVVDNVKKEVRVQFYATEGVTTDSGDYWINLWLLNDGVKSTHLSFRYFVEPSVSY